MHATCAALLVVSACSFDAGIVGSSNCENSDGSAGAETDGVDQTADSNDSASGSGDVTDTDSAQEPHGLCTQPTTPEQLSAALVGTWTGPAHTWYHEVDVTLTFRSDGTLHYDKPDVYSPNTCSADPGMATEGTWRALGPTLVMVVGPSDYGTQCGDGYVRSGISNIYISAGCVLTGETISSALWGNTYYTMFELTKTE